MTYRVLLISAPLKPIQQIWAEQQVKNLFKEFKKQENVFIYSPLDKEIELNCFLYAQQLGLNTTGCFVFERYSDKFSPRNKMKLNEIRKNLYFTKIIDRQPNYEAYRKQTLYLLSQTNHAICIWDQKDEKFSYFYNTLISQWQKKNNRVYHIDYSRFCVTNFIV